MGQAGEGILLVDVGTKRVREASAAYRGMLGYAPEEISPLTLCDLVPYCGYTQYPVRPVTERKGGG